jgi:hypothetical protein
MVQIARNRIALLKANERLGITQRCQARQREQFGNAK